MRGAATRIPERGGGGDTDAVCLRFFGLASSSCEPFAGVEHTPPLDWEPGLEALPHPGVEIPMRDDAEAASCVPLPRTGVEQGAFCRGLATRGVNFLLDFVAAVSTAGAASAAKKDAASNPGAGATRPGVEQAALCLGLLTRGVKFLLIFAFSGAEAASVTKTAGASKPGAGATAGTRHERPELPERGVKFLPPSAANKPGAGATAGTRHERTELPEHGVKFLPLFGTELSAVGTKLLTRGVNLQLSIAEVPLGGCELWLALGAEIFAAAAFAAAAYAAATSPEADPAALERLVLLPRDVERELELLPGLVDIASWRYV